jgi:glycosyltransferase involved in cell wall biosynthesis
MDRGGAERQVCLLAAHLPRTQFSVHVLLLTRGGPREGELRAAGVAYSLIGKRGKLDPRGYRRLRRRLRELQPQLVHTFLFAANCYGRWAARAEGVPVIVGSERCVDPWKRAAHHWIDRQLARVSAAITTNSRGVVDFYREHGIAESLFAVIPNGVAPEQPTGVGREQIARRLGIDGSRKWVLAVGRLWPQKRYRDLIWAADMINTLRGDDTTLIVVGDGPQRGELMRHRDAVTDPHRVHFAGQRSDVRELLSVADAFWLASEYEGQSNALLEAMQAGVPCIVSDIPGNRDLIEHDVTGALVAVGDAADFVRQTQHYWEHTDLCARITATAQRRIAEHFTVERMVEAHVQLYERLLSDAGQ